LNGNEESTTDQTKQRDLNELEEASDVEPDDEDVGSVAEEDEDGEDSEEKKRNSRRLNQSIEFDKDASIAMEDDTTVNIFATLIAITVIYSSL
jgi:hypothetical protein